VEGKVLGEVRRWRGRCWGKEGVEGRVWRGGEEVEGRCWGR